MSRSPSSVRHTRAIQLDRRQRPTSAPLAQAVQDHLTHLLHPAAYAQQRHFAQMGLRARVLTLPVMAATVATVIWRSVGSVAEAARVLEREGFLWCSPVAVSPQALAGRMRTLPPALFEGIFEEVRPALLQRAEARAHLMPAVVRRARDHFTSVVAFDGSTLDALMRKVGLLRVPGETASGSTAGSKPGSASGSKLPAPLGGRMAALLDVGTRLPHRVWIEPDAAAHDQRFWERALAALAPETLVVFDRGLINYPVFADLTAKKVGFITRPKTNARIEVIGDASACSLASGSEAGEATTDGAATSGAAISRACDQWVYLGGPDPKTGQRLRMRRVAVLHHGRTHVYLTNVMDPAVLSASDVAALYRLRWRIEDAFKDVKRLLGLAYLAGSSVNAVHLQVWMTWVLYAALIDLAGQVAEALGKPLARISVEMVYRGLYHAAQAVQRGETDDPVAYLAAQAKDLGIVKRMRRASSKKSLTLSAGP
jgi:hypothetical protein